MYWNGSCNILYIGRTKIVLTTIITILMAPFHPLSLEPFIPFVFHTTNLLEPLTSKSWITWEYKEGLRHHSFSWTQGHSKGIHKKPWSLHGIPLQTNKKEKQTTTVTTTRIIRRKAPVLCFVCYLWMKYTIVFTVRSDRTRCINVQFIVFVT